MKREKLIEAAKELNELLGLDPAIPTKKNTDEDLIIEKICEAAELIEEGDEVSEETIEVLTELEAPGFEAEEAEEDPEEDPEPEEKPAKKSKKEDEKPAAKPADKKKAKKEEAEEDPEPEEEDEKPAKKSAKKEEKKPAAKKEAPAKKKEKGPGVIQTIADLIEGAGKKGISKDDILKELEETFPDKALDSMKGTINVQVPNRISRERFQVERLENGNYRKAEEVEKKKKK